MKVQVLQEELSKALNICSRFSSNKVQLPVLANVLLTTDKSKFRISSTNLEVSVSIAIGAKVVEEGSLTVPSKIILDLVSNLRPGQIDLFSEKEVLKISSDSFDSTITGMNSSEFPVVPTEVGAGSLKLASSDFEKALSKVLFSVSVDETRPTLTGVLCIFGNDEVIFVSTDGFRLSQKKIKSGSQLEGKKIIVPKGTFSELPRMIDGDSVDLSFKKTENQIVFGLSNKVVGSRVIDGEFPDFERIIPKVSKIRVNVDKEEFLRNIKLASVFAKDSANVVKLSIKENSLEINAESQQHGTQKSTLDAKVERDSKDKFEIAFNYRFLEEVLNVVDSDDVQIEFSEPNSPVLFIDKKDSNYLHIIMPVKLQ
jgi:DNA polymerase III subunit beta